MTANQETNRNAFATIRVIRGSQFEKPSDVSETVGEWL
jgi:hypothetical protein